MEKEKLEPDIQPSSRTATKSKMDPEALKLKYLTYIAKLNARHTTELDDLVNDQVTHNFKQMSRAEYGAMILGHMEASPDFHFEPEILVADGDKIAARLLISLTPSKDFLGFKPSGKKIEFMEHVFYRFEGGRIKEVWSLVDEGAIERQLGQRSDPTQAYAAAYVESV